MFPFIVAAVQRGYRILVRPPLRWTIIRRCWEGSKYIALLPRFTRHLKNDLDFERFLKERDRNENLGRHFLLKSTLFRVIVAGKKRNYEFFKPWYFFFIFFLPQKKIYPTVLLLIKLYLHFPLIRDVYIININLRFYYFSELIIVTSRCFVCISSYNFK